MCSVAFIYCYDFVLYLFVPDFSSSMHDVADMSDCINIPFFIFWVVNELQAMYAQA